MLSNHTMSSIKAASLFISPDQVSFFALSIYPAICFVQNLYVDSCDETS